MCYIVIILYLFLFRYYKDCTYGISYNASSAGQITFVENSRQFDTSFNHNEQEWVAWQRRFDINPCSYRVSWTLVNNFLKVLFKNLLARFFLFGFVVVPFTA